MLLGSNIQAGPGQILFRELTWEFQLFCPEGRARELIEP